MTSNVTWVEAKWMIEHSALRFRKKQRDNTESKQADLANSVVQKIANYDHG